MPAVCTAVNNPSNSSCGGLGKARGGVAACGCAAAATPPLRTNASAEAIVARATLTMRSPWTEYSETGRRRGVGRSLRHAGQSHDPRGIALDADVHALATEGEVVQCQGLPPGRQYRCVRFYQPGLADAQSAETVEQALQITARAGDEIAGIVARRFGAHVEGWLERAAREVGGKPGGGIGITANGRRGDRSR